MALVNLTIIVLGGVDPADAVKIRQLAEKLKEGRDALDQAIEDTQAQAAKEG